MKKVLLVVVACLGLALVPVTGATAEDVPLLCTENPLDPQAPMDPIGGKGVVEQRTLNNEVFIPAHAAECPRASGTISYRGATELQAIDDLQSRRVHWIGLNAPLSATEWAVMVASRNHPGIRTSAVYQLPLFLDGFVVTANVTSCTAPAGGVKLTPLTLSLIYSGVATTWGHEELVKDNPLLAGCAQRIAVAVRDGAAWSNAVLKDYMSKRNPVFTAYKARELLGSWPGALEIGCRGYSDAGMATCAEMAGAISYLPYRTAKAYGLLPAKVQNGAGKYQPPATNTAHVWPSNCPAAVPASLTEGYPFALGDWSTFSLTYRDKGYGLCGASFVVTFLSSGGAAPEWSDSEVHNLKDHIRIFARPTTQAALKSYGYAPLPPIAISGLEAAATGMN